MNNGFCRALTLLSFILCTTFAFAQQKTVSGTVVDQSGAPLIGVNVVVKGTTTGIITDVDGNYSLSVSANSTLVFSYIGYKTQEIAVGNQVKINVTMQEESEQIEEVVVVGYGSQKKVTVTGAVASVTGEKLTASPTTNLSNGMLGRLPGVIGFQRSDEPGGGATTIRIRGNNTLGSKDPLIVVDGVADRAGGMDRIDPNDIESISVLKDAAASIYGSRAANGVILITTKKGKEGKTNVQFTGSYGFSKPTLLPEMCDAYEYATMINEIQPGAYSDEDLALYRNGNDPWGHPNTNWYDAVIKDFSPIYRADLSINGGTNKMKYYVNFGTNGEDGIYKNSANRYDQYGIRANLDFKLGEYINISYGTTARYQYTQYPAKSASSIFSATRRSKPTLPAYWPTGEVGPDIEYGDNPVATASDAAGWNHQKNYYIQNNVKLTVDIPWVKGLKFTGTASYDKRFYNGKNWNQPVVLYSWDGVTENASGLTPYKAWISDPRLTRTDNDFTDWLLNAVLSWDRTFGHHTVGIMAGIEGQSKARDYLQAYRRYFPSTALTDLDLGSVTGMTTAGNSYEETRRNYFGRVSYNYLERYLFEFVWRYDGSYRFPSENRYGFFPGLMAAWRVSEEPWFKEKVNWMNYLKVRASVSQTGNDILTDADSVMDQSIQYLNTFAFQSTGWIFGGKESQRLYPSRTPNPSITWEKGTTYDVGLEMKFLDNRLSIEGDWFLHKRTGMLITRAASFPQIAGFTLPRENLGKMQNTGFDALIDWQDKIGQVGYNLSLNMSYARNKVTFWDEINSDDVPEWQRATGHPIPTSGTYAALRDGGGLYYKADGVFNTQEELDSYPHWAGAQLGDVKFVDVNNDGKIDWKDRIRSDKNQTPRFVAGFTVGLNYKNFDLMALFQGAMGAETYIQTWSGTVGNFLKEYYDQRWTKDNWTSEHPRTYERENQYWINNANTMFLRNNDYIRLKNVEIGYTLPRGISKLGVSKLRFFINGQNIFTICGVPGDPENTAASFDYYPQRQYYSVGLTANF